MIQATVAVYPLGGSGFRAVDLAVERLRAAGVVVEVRPMQTELAGEAAAVFAALAEAYDAAAAEGGVVMTVTVSNACPAPAVEGP